MAKNSLPPSSSTSSVFPNWTNTNQSSQKAESFYSPSQTYQQPTFTPPKTQHFSSIQQPQFSPSMQRSQPPTDLNSPKLTNPTQPSMPSGLPSINQQMTVRQMIDQARTFEGQLPPDLRQFLASKQISTQYFNGTNQK
jgi:hypothetical protein